MEINESLRKYQPNAYKLFSNVLKSDTFFHGYLLSGEKGSSLGKIAKYLAKSLLCKEDIFACNHCSICERVEHDNYGDLLIYNAKTESLKIDQIRNEIELFFSKTSLEKRGIKIYIIENIEYLNAQGSNALLKFLEEPPKNVYAIFTSENETRILPTILSRLQIIRFNKIDKDIFIKKANEDNIDTIDIYLLSLLFNDYDEMILNASNDNFSLTKELFLEYLKELKNPQSLRFFIETKLLKGLDNKEKVYFFYDLFLSFLKESYEYKLKIKNKEDLFLKPFINYIEIIITSIADIDKFIDKLLLDEYQIARNVNLNLLLIHSFCND